MTFLLRLQRISSRPRILRSLLREPLWTMQRFSVASSPKKKMNASDYIAGVTNEDVLTNPAYRDYFETNFPEFLEELDGHSPTPTTTVIRKKGTTDIRQGSPKTIDSKEIQEKETQELKPNNNIRTLWCYQRKEQYEEGTRSCDHLRSQGLIPGILYGSDPTQKIRSQSHSSSLLPILVKTPYSVIQRELDRFTYHKFESRVYDLTIYEHPDDDQGTVHRVMPRNVQHHPVKTMVYCVNYLRYFPGRPISLPILYINEEESPAMKRGGFIAPIHRYVSCVIEDGVPIPEHLELECTGLNLKDVVRMDRILFPEGVKVSQKVDVKSFLVGTVFGRRADAGTEETK